MHLTSEPRRPLPSCPGQPERYEGEDRREGPANLWLVGHPRRGWRPGNGTKQRTNQAFAPQRRLRVDQDVPTAECLRGVVAPLKTPTPAAVYRVVPPNEARRLTRTLDFHYTPKQGSWLKMAEGEVAGLASQGLDRRLPNLETVQTEITAGQAQRNPPQANIHWQFDPDGARVTLKRLYPSVGPSEHPLGPEIAEPGKTFAAAH